MPPALLLRRALSVVLVGLVVLFGGAAIVISAREAPSAPQASELRSARIQAPEGVPFTELPLPTVPATTQPPPPPPPEPEPEPDPAPAPSPGPATGGSRQEVGAAPAPAPAAAPGGSCQNLGGGALVAAHSSVKPYSGDGALSASATGWALTLCNAHAGENVFHSGQAAGENLAWVYSSGGCLNNAAMVMQAWLSSPTHRANIDRFSVVGAGVACDGSNTYFVAQYR